MTLPTDYVQSMSVSKYKIFRWVESLRLYMTDLCNKISVDIKISSAKKYKNKPQ